MSEGSNEFQEQLPDLIQSKKPVLTSAYKGPTEDELRTAKEQFEKQLASLKYEIPSHPDALALQGYRDILAKYKDQPEFGELRDLQLLFIHDAYRPCKTIQGQDFLCGRRMLIIPEDNFVKVVRMYYPNVKDDDIRRTFRGLTTTPFHPVEGEDRDKKLIFHSYVKISPRVSELGLLIATLHEKHHLDKSRIDRTQSRTEALDEEIEAVVLPMMTLVKILDRENSPDRPTQFSLVQKRLRELSVGHRFGGIGNAFRPTDQAVALLASILQSIGIRSYYPGSDYVLLRNAAFVLANIDSASSNSTRKIVELIKGSEEWKALGKHDQQ